MVDIHSRNCYFCHSKLVDMFHKHTVDCVNPECTHKYQLVRICTDFTGLGKISYQIGDKEFGYVFNVNGTFKSMWVAIAGDRKYVKHEKPLVANLNNYQQVYDKVLGLQVFT